MEEPMSMDEIKRQIQDEKAKAAYAEKRAAAEVQATVDTALDANKTIKAKLNHKLAEHIDSSEIIDEKIGHVAEDLANVGLEAQSNEVHAGKIDSENKILVADFEKNKDEYMYHGIDKKIDKAWKRKMILFINDVWFIIWAIVSAFTIVPAAMLLSRIKALSGLVKWIATCVGIILGLACLAGLTYAALTWSGLLTIITKKGG